jgi:MFS superfamily sulfate permease-like transporter
MRKYFQTVGSDLPASIVVLLVALPLCLGIALGSGAPLFSGIIAGVVGGILVGTLSGSHLSVSGPAAGLTVIVANGILKLESYDVFLLAVVIAGVFQIILGYIKAGILGDFVPNSVIKGMLAAIGLILILKQLPHLVGYDADFEGDETFTQADANNTFTELLQAGQLFTGGAVIIGLVSLVILILWEKKVAHQKTVFHFFPGALVAVVIGILLNEFFKSQYPNLALEPKHLVSLPIITNLENGVILFTMPDFSKWNNPNVWIIAFTLTMVASLETLLGIEAIDKLDSLKRVTPTNRELKVQGLGNIVSGLMGGLPITSVLIRSSVNVMAGAKSKMSSIFHGILLMLFVVLIPVLLNKIPLSALAAILIFTGYKLASLKQVKAFYSKGWDQFVPFIGTIIAILFTDLLTGIIIGILVGLFFMLRSNFRSAVFEINDNNNHLLRLRKDVSFLNKAIIKAKLEAIPPNAYLLIDTTRAEFIDRDIVEEINAFLCHAHLKNIKVEMKKSPFKRNQYQFQEPTINT